MTHKQEGDNAPGLKFPPRGRKEGGGNKRKSKTGLPAPTETPTQTALGVQSPILGASTVLGWETAPYLLPFHWAANPRHPD